jgi:hypothetical protein
MEETLTWFKSSFSGANGCVEAAHLPDGGLALRDGKDRGKGAHYFGRDEWDAFLAGVKAGGVRPALAAVRGSRAHPRPFCLEPRLLLARPPISPAGRHWTFTSQ